MEKLTLERVLEAFNAPVNEEQAWSVCYQCSKFLAERRAAKAADCGRFSGVRSVEIGKDGNVSAIIADPGASHTGSAVSEYELVQSLGVVVFHALDYGLSDTEEQTLSPALESLLELMTVSESDDEDEGRGNDVEGDEGFDAGDEAECSEAQPHDDGRITLARVMELCSEHLQNPKEAASHYKAVCRALVTEASELLTFLEKISVEKKLLQLHRKDLATDDTDASNLDVLESADWARLWMQVMRQLRYGAKLKKVEQPHVLQHTTEFELTPYEILMEDIRSRRYTLNKVLVNGDLAPRMKKDAHEVILEFIRSRPPLHSVKDRKLSPMPLREEDPREMLLKSIRSDPKLKPTPGHIVETSRTKLSEDEDTPAPTRKVIKPDLTLLLSDDEDDYDDDDDQDDELEDRNKVTPSPLEPLTPLSPPTPARPLPWQHAVTMQRVHSLQSPPERRHSITVCETPTTPGGKLGCYHLPDMPIYGPSMSSPRSISLFSANGEPHRTLQSSLECLSLTIEEVMHIRSVLTKAELECLLVNPELYELVSKGKICFTCKTSRFSIFVWSTKCRFCKRSVCSKCYSKMRIPTEHFEHIPVYTLSPSPIGSETEDFFVCEKTGSVPATPEPQPRTIALPPDIINNNGHHNPKPARRPPLQRSRTVMKPPPSRVLQGPLMNVCRDCKAMIVSIIRSSRSSLATAPTTPRDLGGFPECPSRRVSRNFHLDLKPVYK